MRFQLHSHEKYYNFKDRCLFHILGVRPCPVWRLYPLSWHLGCSGTPLGCLHLFLPNIHHICHSLLFILIGCVVDHDARLSKTLSLSSAYFVRWRHEVKELFWENVPTPTQCPFLVLRFKVMTNYINLFDKHQICQNNSKCVTKSNSQTA